MAQVTIVLDTSKPDDLETLLKAFGSLPGNNKSMTLDPAAGKKDKPKETPKQDPPKGEDKADEEIAGAMSTEKAVSREDCLVLAKTKTGVKVLLAKMEAKEGKLSNLPDEQLAEFYKQCKALPNK